MKKSDLKAFVKEEILSTLTTEGVWSKGDDTAIRDFILDVKQLKDDYYHIVGSDDVFDGLDAAIRAANELIAMNEDAQTQQDIKDTEELTKAMANLAKAKEEAGLKEAEAVIPQNTLNQFAAAIKNPQTFASHIIALINKIAEKENETILNNPKLKRAIDILKDLSDDKQEVSIKEEDKEPSKADLKKTKGLAKAKEELAQLTKQMKSLARKYKEAEGAEKEKIVADLKKKTKLKKELEAIIDK
jgi:hypothetical protein